MKPPAATVGCFGKVPSSGDFIRAHSNPPVMAMLDRWLAQSMRLLSAEPRWKIHYDAAAPFDFAFVGPQRRHAIAGRIDLSQDQAGRRYPLLLMSAVEVGTSRQLLAFSPIAFAPAWDRFGTIAADLRTSADLEAILARSGELVADALPDTDAAGVTLAEFVNGQTLAALNASLARAGHAASARDVLLALGVLMKPVMACRGATLDHSLRLPLPAPIDERRAVACFYLSLMAPFIAGADYEVALLLPHGRQELVVGFSGAAPRLLQAVVDPQAAGEYLIGLDTCDWIDSEIAGKAHLSHFSCLLDQPNLQLASARKHFEAAFLGG